MLVDTEHILQVVSKWTGVPLKRIEQGEAQRLLTLENELSQVVIGQQEAVSSLCKALRRSRADLKDPKRPIGSFALLGPTGVGKTLLAKTLAEVMFGDSKSLIQLDMSEYMEKFTVSRLVGSPPGYVGYEEGGQLTEQVRRRPYSVVLFDEIEKAHPDVMNMLLQILEEGKLTDNVGRVVDFRNTIILLTSNIGAEMVKKDGALGFTPVRDDGNYEYMRGIIMDEAKRVFRPEFINRLGDIVVFRPLTKPNLIDILDLEIAKVIDRLKDRHIHFEMTPEAKGFLEDPLAEEILRGNVHDNEPMVVVLEGDHLVFAQKASPEETTVGS